MNIITLQRRFPLSKFFNEFLSFLLLSFFFFFLSGALSLQIRYLAYLVWTGTPRFGKQPQREFAI